MKWIIRFTLPSGLRMAASSHDGCFAFVKIEQTGVVRKANCWETESEARKYWQALLSSKPDDIDFSKLPPEFVQCMVAT